MTKRRSKPAKIDKTNIVSRCQITNKIWDNKKQIFILKTIDTVLYTPKHINAGFKKHGITNCSWIITPWGKELWSPGKQLAQARG